MFRSVFQVNGDVLDGTGLGMKGPSWVLAISVGSLLVALGLAVVHVSGLMPGRLPAHAALACAGLTLLSLVGLSLIWPRYRVRLDRISRRMEIRDGSGSSHELPVEEVRFAIRPRRAWYLFSRQPCWAFISKIPEHDELQLFFTVRKDRVELLWQELGKWLARGTDTQKQTAVNTGSKPRVPKATGQGPKATGQGPRSTRQGPKTTDQSSRSSDEPSAQGSSD